MDVVVTWPDNCDYPLWRRFIHINRKAFENVIIVIMKTNDGYNYNKFIKEQMGGDCIVVDSPDVKSGEDWRDVAVNFALSKSDADFVWFTEQDFITHEGFWDDVKKQLNEGCKIIAYFDHYRMHPCCIFADTEVIDKTRRDFSVVAGVSDHFAKFQEDIDEMFYNDELIMGTVETHFEHLNGLSSNFYLISKGQLPNYQPKRFREYIVDSLNSGMVMHPEYIRVCKEYLQI